VDYLSVNWMCINGLARIVLRPVLVLNRGFARKVLIRLFSVAQRNQTLRARPDALHKKSWTWLFSPRALRISVASAVKTGPNRRERKDPPRLAEKIAGQDPLLCKARSILNPYQRVTWLQGMMYFEQEYCSMLVSAQTINLVVRKNAPRTDNR
jgi:hypothetical protein